MRNLQKNNFLKCILGVLIALAFSLSYACESDSKADQVSYQCPMQCEGEKTYSEPGNCPVCNMKLAKTDGELTKIKAENGEISETSIFNLTSKWHTQNNKTITLRELRGDILVIVMIYTSCEAACPRLVADVRHIHGQVEANDQVKYVFVSIDPETDTPLRLKAFAEENQMQSDEWLFLHSEMDNVREFANVLAVKYKKIAPLSFSHSNIISVFDKEGDLHHQQEGLGVSTREIVAKINALAN